MWAGCRVFLFNITALSTQACGGNCNLKRLPRQCQTFSHKFDHFSTRRPFCTSFHVTCEKSGQTAKWTQWKVLANVINRLNTSLIWKPVLCLSILTFSSISGTLCNVHFNNKFKLAQKKFWAKRQKYNKPVLFEVFRSVAGDDYRFYWILLRLCRPPGLLLIGKEFFSSG